MMTVERLQEKKNQSPIKDFDLLSDEKVQEIAKDFAVVLDLIHYKNLDTNNLVQNMGEQLSKLDSITSPKGRDMLHSAITDCLGKLNANIQFYLTLIAQCETAMDLELKEKINND